MKYFLIAGEASGDLHASNLMRAIMHRDPEAQFRFYGGDLTQQDFEDKCRNIAGFFQKRYDYIIEHYGE